MVLALSSERPFIPSRYRRSSPAGLTVDTAELFHPQYHHPHASAAADPLSARLTPSPHCSPVSTSALGSGSSAGTQQRVELQDSLGFQNHAMRSHVKLNLQDERLMCRSLGLRPLTLKTVRKAPEPRWPPARPGSAYVLRQSRCILSFSNHGIISYRVASPDVQSQLCPGYDDRGFDALDRPEPFANHGLLAGGTGSGRAHSSCLSFAQPSITAKGYPIEADDWRLQPATNRLGSTVRPGDKASESRRLRDDALFAPDGPHQLVKKELQKTQPLPGFQPMMAVAAPEKRRISLAAMQLKDKDFNKFSSRYYGMHTDSNASAEHLTPDMNCALWLTNLPADVSYDELLGSISNVGRIWCTFINSPDNIKHRTAAKVVFFSNEAAQKLLRLSWTDPIIIRGHRVKVSHNRIKYSRNTISGKMSRVLIITGQDDFVNAANLQTWFQERFVYQVDRIINLIKAKGRTVCAFRFGSYRCQAQMGKMALEKDRPAGFEKVEFGDGPCEFGEIMTSYGIAGERIQGKGLLKHHTRPQAKRRFAQ